ncbi:MAG: hypothetical protein HY067_09625 [Betaproteobacteria bacterium]|nr:hypothetical protein [Betaproteobacteria bacterium]
MPGPEHSSRHGAPLRSLADVLAIVLQDLGKARALKDEAARLRDVAREKNKAAHRVHVDIEKRLAGLGAGPGFDVAEAAARRERSLKIKAAELRKASREKNRRAHFFLSDAQRGMAVLGLRFADVVEAEKLESISMRSGA